MTTKYKIIIGFVAMMLLMGILAFLGYSSLQTASNNFDAYRHLARVNVALSDMLAAQNYATSEMRQFRMMGRGAFRQQGGRSVWPPPCCWHKNHSMQLRSLL